MSIPTTRFTFFPIHLIPFPNDPNYQNGSDEWNVNQVHMDQAWNDPDPWIANASLGRPSAKIAIVDSGILATHEEFVGKIDPNSYNTVLHNNDLTDTDGHGTAVAGIASVNTNNNKGGGDVRQLFFINHERWRY